ncbi:MAG TPA: hypothetical protein VK171_14375 [Fimbriimonas sp.]|nr:hypothetical protein [Fimbriimonas sp.]
MRRTLLAVLGVTLLACGGTLSGVREPLPASGTWTWGTGSGPAPVTNTFDVVTGGLTLPAGIRPGLAFGETPYETESVEKLAVRIGMSGSVTAGSTWNLADADQGSLVYEEIGSISKTWRAFSGSVVLVSIEDGEYTFAVSNAQMVFDDGTEPTPSTPRRNFSGMLKVRVDLI